MLTAGRRDTRAKFSAARGLPGGSDAKTCESEKEAAPITHRLPFTEVFPERSFD
jgi:hypothetical protein